MFDKTPTFVDLRPALRWLGMLIILTSATPSWAEPPTPGLIVPRRAIPTDLSTEDLQKRDALMEVAVAAMKEGDWQAAVENADRAFELAPSRRTALLAAQFYLERERWQVALERLLAAVNLPLDPAVDADFVKLLTEISAARGLAWGGVETEPKGAQLKLGSTLIPAGTTFAVTLGRHRLTADATGYSEATTELDAQAGKPFTSYVRLVAVEAVPSTVTVVESRTLKPDYVRFAPLSPRGPRGTRCSPRRTCASPSKTRPATSSSAQPGQGS